MEYVNNNPGNGYPTLGLYPFVNGHGKQRSRRAPRSTSMFPAERPIPRNHVGWDVHHDPDAPFPYNCFMQVIPYMDAVDLLEHNSDREVAVANLGKYFGCPSREAGDYIRWGSSWWYNEGEGPVIRNSISYAASYGMRDTRRPVPWNWSPEDSDPGGALPNTWGGDPPYGPYGKKIKSQGSTFLLGEKYIDADQAGRAHCGEAFGLRSGRFEDNVPDTVRTGSLPPRPIRPGELRVCADVFDCSDDIGFGSWHPSGCHMLYVDGSVALVNYGVDMELWGRQHLARYRGYAN
jgi:prepilin-type processing-associated H-X9-DG protein